MIVGFSFPRRMASAIARRSLNSDRGAVCGSRGILDDLEADLCADRNFGCIVASWPVGVKVNKNAGGNTPRQNLAHHVGIEVVFNVGPAAFVAHGVDERDALGGGPDFGGEGGVGAVDGDGVFVEEGFYLDLVVLGLGGGGAEGEEEGEAGAWGGSFG